jgi:hypothetical protein
MRFFLHIHPVLWIDMVFVAFHAMRPKPVGRGMRRMNARKD